MHEADSMRRFGVIAQQVDVALYRDGAAVFATRLHQLTRRM